VVAQSFFGLSSRSRTCNAQTHRSIDPWRPWRTGSEAFSRPKSSPSGTAKGTSSQATASAPVAAAAKATAARARARSAEAEARPSDHPQGGAVDKSASVGEAILRAVHTAAGRAND